MSKPIIGPLGLSLRDSLLLATIVASMALSACMTSEEQKQREEKVEQIKADARARLEQQEQQKKQANQEQQENPATMAAREAALKEWLTKWVKDNESYIRGLCASDPGTEHQWTWDNFKVAVSTDSQHASKARDTGRPVIDCEDFRVQKPAEFNADAFMAAVIADQKKRDEWLASAVGKEYQRHLCSLSGAERQQALAAATQLHGIIPRENVIDEKKARKHGFAILDCVSIKTSSLGYTWSNAWAPLHLTTNI